MIVLFTLIVQVRLGTTITINRDQYRSICWSNARQATKDLAVAVFGKETLASSSLTGQASNANLLKVSKPSLDPTKVKDIVGMVYLIFIFSYLYISGYLSDFIRNICTRIKCAFSLSTAKHLMHIIMRPSSLGGGRIMRRTLSVRLSVCPSVRPVIIGHVFSAPLASRMYFSARTEGRISYGHLGCTDSC